MGRRLCASSHIICAKKVSLLLAKVAERGLPAAVAAAVVIAVGGGVSSRTAPPAAAAAAMMMTCVEAKAVMS